MLEALLAIGGMAVFVVLLGGTFVLLGWLVKIAQVEHKRFPNDNDGTSYPAI
jgi:hypothetical protein